jgi:hypothetical protein
MLEWRRNRSPRMLVFPIFAPTSLQQATTAATGTFATFHRTAANRCLSRHQVSLSLVNKKRKYTTHRTKALKTDSSYTPLAPTTSTPA